MPLLNIENTFNTYDIVTISNGVANLIDISNPITGVVGIVLNENYIAVDYDLTLDTRQWNNGDLLYAGVDSRLTNVQPVATFDSSIGYVVKSNILGKIVLLQTGNDGLPTTTISKIQAQKADEEFIYLKTSDDGELLIKDLNSFNNTDLLQLIFEQLTEQTKLLKKIYQ